MALIQELMSDRFGAQIDWRENPVADDVDTADKAILRNNPDRIMFVMINLSANNIFIAPETPATTTRGIRLNAGGGNATFTVENDGPLPGLEWHAVAAANNSAYFLVEIFKAGSA